MLAGDIDQEDEFLIGKAVVSISLVIHEYIGFGVCEETGPEILVIVVIIGALHLLQVLDDCGCDGVVEPLILLESLQDVVRDGAGILRLESIDPAIVQVSIVVTLTDIATTLGDLAPQIGALLVGQVS